MTKVFSNDKILWVNMTIYDARNCGVETLKIFEDANKNKDLILDVLEINEYNAKLCKCKTTEEEDSSTKLQTGQVSKNGETTSTDDCGEIPDKDIVKINNIVNKLLKELENKCDKISNRTLIYSTLGGGAGIGFLGWVAFGGPYIGGAAAIGLVLGLICGDSLLEGRFEHQLESFNKLFQEQMGDLMFHPYAQTAYNDFLKRADEIVKSKLESPNCN